MPRHELPLPLGRRFYRRPCAACSASSALLKVSVAAFLKFSTTSCGASLLWASEATSSLLAGKVTFGRYCWSWPRSRLPRSPRLPRLMPSTSRIVFYDIAEHLTRHVRRKTVMPNTHLLPYSPKCLEGKFSEVRRHGVLGSSLHPSCKEWILASPEPLPLS